MLDLHFKQPGFTYCACGLFTKHVKNFKNLEKTSILKYLYRNELDKAYFAHNAAYSDSKNLTKRAISDKVLKEKADKIARNPKYDGYQRALASIVYKFFNVKDDQE